MLMSEKNSKPIVTVRLTISFLEENGLDPYVSLTIYRHRKILIVWKHLLLEGMILALGHSGKYGFRKGLKYLFAMLGF